MKDGSKRKFLANAGYLIGASLSPLSMQALAAAGTYSPGKKLMLLSESQYAMLAAITEIIIPTTDTPGAIEAGVPDFVEHMLVKFMSEEEADEWLLAFMTFEKQVGFHQLSKQQQLDVVKNLDERLGKDDFYSKLKELTLVGYYTSEIGASVELQYDPVPGPYREIPLNKIDRAWS